MIHILIAQLYRLYFVFNSSAPHLPPANVKIITYTHNTGLSLTHIIIHEVHSIIKN
jgi:hypothetical protein